MWNRRFRRLVWRRPARLTTAGSESPVMRRSRLGNVGNYQDVRATSSLPALSVGSMTTTTDDLVVLASNVWWIPLSSFMA